MAQSEPLIEDVTIWGIAKEVAAEALRTLRSCPIHPAFTAYLCLKREARHQGREDDLQLRYQTFFTTFLKLGDQPSNLPYLMPFNESGKPTPANALFNKNVAGSYAPSSIRSTSPLRKVAEISGKGAQARCRLVFEHAHHALEHMLNKKKISPVALATVLYRDFGLIGAQPTADDLLSIFRNDFGYREDVPEELEQYKELFTEIDDPTRSIFRIEPLL